MKLFIEFFFQAYKSSVLEINVRIGVFVLPQEILVEFKVVPEFWK